MKNKLICGLVLGAVLSGCAGPAREAIPVVDAGSPLNKQQQAAGKTSTSARPAPESAYQKPQEQDLPSLPIQEESIEVPQTPQVVQYEEPELLEQAQVQANVQVAAVQSTAPVQALLRTAQQQQSGGDLNGAATSLERAQRIAPRDPQVLYRLAEVRLAQGDAREAEQLAQRGLGFSSGQPGLQAGLWDLIADAREKLGDAQGAEQARSRARVEL